MKTGTLLTVGIAFLAVFFLLSVILLKLTWEWIVPDIFPGAVETGLVVPALTWAQAAKLAICLSIVGTALGTKSSSKS